jgi:hypothetical protein
MVLLKFKRGTCPASIAQGFAALAKLQEQVPGIERYGGGPYSSPEGINQGFTHGFLMTFADAAARDRYLTHPDHERVKDELLRIVEDVIAFDFEE